MNTDIKDKLSEDEVEKMATNSLIYWTDLMMGDIDKIVKKYQPYVLPELYPFNSPYEGYACIQDLIDKTMYHNSNGMKNKDLLWKDIKLGSDTNLLYNEIKKDSFYMSQDLKQSVISLLGVIILCERMVDLTTENKND